MIPNLRLTGWCLAACLLAATVVFGADKGFTPNSVELICQVDSVSTPPGNQNIVIPVYLTNIYDSVGAFQLWIVSSDAGIIRFAADSVGGVVYGRVDTTGTLSRGGNVIAHILDPLHGTLKIEGHFSPPPTGTGPIPPGSGMLIKLIAETNGMLDSEAIVILSFDHSQSLFAKPDGQLIGCVYDSLGECTIDTARVVLFDGKVSVEPGPPCGDVNGDGVVDISDVIQYVVCIFGGGDCPCFHRQPNSHCDANCDGAVDISDAVHLIQYIFAGGPAPCCL